GNPLERFSAGQYAARESLYGLMALLLLLPLVFGADRPTPLRRALSLRPAIFVGVVSYGMYLWHYPVLIELSDRGLASVRGIHPYLLWGVSAVVLSLALGALSYYLVERPALSFKRLVGRPPRMPDEAVAEPAP